MKIVKSAIFFLVGIFFLSGCAITHTFGPYRGKVVDKESGAPIEGAAVLIHFNTLRMGPTYHFVDAIETLTDKEGKFEFDAQHPIVFRILSEWVPYGYITIFKPGYGAYPRHPQSSPMYYPHWTIPPDENTIFKLPKLLTLDERKKNILSADPHIGVPDDNKKRNLLRLINIELKNVGFQLLPKERYGD